jgi:hypothetical protein
MVCMVLRASPVATVLSVLRAVVHAASGPVQCPSAQCAAADDGTGAPRMCTGFAAQLLAFCMGRGPLAQLGQLTTGQFAALLLWPLNPETTGMKRQHHQHFTHESIILSCAMPHAAMRLHSFGRCCPRHFEQKLLMYIGSEVLCVCVGCTLLCTHDTGHTRPWSCTPVRLTVLLAASSLGTHATAAGCRAAAGRSEDGTMQVLLVGPKLRRQLATGRLVRRMPENAGERGRGNATLVPAATSSSTSTVLARTASPPAQLHVTTAGPWLQPSNVPPTDGTMPCRFSAAVFVAGVYLLTHPAVHPFIKMYAAGASGEAPSRVTAPTCPGHPPHPSPNPCGHNLSRHLAAVALPRHLNAAPVSPCPCPAPPPPFLPPALPGPAAFCVCCYCDLCANAAAALVLLLHGITTTPSWDRPWLQTSLGDFWARRWNLPASASLKYLAYDPAVEGEGRYDTGVVWERARGV